jgi:hypothetical protein
MSMNIRKWLCTALLGFVGLQAVNISVYADEGMWPLNNVPRAEIKKKFDFDVTDEWLRKLQLASVRFNNGGSGSFVSQNGLVLTNYHIVEDIVKEVSTPERDLAKEGFVARSQADEIKTPSLELNVLMSIEDVTARVNGAIKASMSDSEAFAARRAEISSIEGESTKATGLRSDVITLYQGGQYNLYRYKKYTDVRLVFVPEFQAAFFGGDPDNFNFPRFNIDMALVRIYENGQPVHPASYFKWSTAGTKEGDLVFVTGNPGTTSRLNIVAHLEELRDTSIPIILRLLERREAMLKKYMAMGEEQTRQGQNELNDIQSSLKFYRGRLAGLKDKALMNRKQVEESTLRKSIAANPEQQKMYGDAWDAIAKAHRDYLSYIKERRIFDQAGGFNSVSFDNARTLVRLAAENAKPNSARLPEYTDANRASLELGLYSPVAIHREFEKLKLADSFGFMIELLGVDNPLVMKVLNGKTAEARAAELIDGTKLNDVAYRKGIAKGGQQSIESSTDPMIVLASMIDLKARELRKRYEREVTGVERANYARIARARFEIFGTKLYPDGTFTLRVSYGAVKGYMETGNRVAPYTRLQGLYDRAALFNGEYPNDLPSRWLEKATALDLGVPLNFVTTNDVNGGNSGSPTINEQGELIGMIFDSNTQSLVSDYIYDESTNRAISVDARAMLEVLRKIFNANEIADELAPIDPRLNADVILDSMKNNLIKLSMVYGNEHREISAQLEDVTTKVNALKSLVALNPQNPPSEPYLRDLALFARLLQTSVDEPVTKKTLQARLDDVAADLNVKVVYAESQEDKPLGRVQVTIHTLKQGEQETSGYEVWYAGKAFMKDVKNHQRFDSLSSPTMNPLNPGNYFFWARKGDFTSKPQLMTIGGSADRRPMREISLTVR